MQALVAALKENSEYCKLQEHIDNNLIPLHVWGMNKRTTPLIMETISRESNLRLVVTYEERRAREIVDDYKLYNRDVFYYPAKDALFYYADIHSNDTVKSRLEIFKRIANNQPTVVVTTIDGLMDKIPGIEYITKYVIKLRKDETLDLDDFSKRLSILGYEKRIMVEEPGQFSVRGGIIDIFPLTEECPCRVELWGDDVESIRIFDVETQRSIEEVNEISIYPACEMVLSDSRVEKGLDKITKEHKKQAALLKKEFRTEQYARLNKMVENIKEELREFNSTMGLDSLVTFFYDETVSFLEYFPYETEIFIDAPEKVYNKAIVYSNEFAMSMEGRLLGGYVLPSQTNVLFAGKEIVGKLSNRRIIMLSEIYSKQIAWGERKEYNFESRQIVSYNNSFEALMKDIKKWQNKKYKIAILSPSSTRGKRIANNLRDNDIVANYRDVDKVEIKNGDVAVFTGSIECGYEIPCAKLVVIGESDIFTSKELEKKRKLKKNAGDKINSFSDLTVGDYVVHQNHGIGIYTGIEKVETDGRMKDYICLEYAKGSKLFIPVNQLDMIGKFSSKDGAKPKINVLGGAEWQKVRQKVKGHVADIAKELVELYAIREASRGFSYSEDSQWQKEFEELFPYEETLDQQKAIEDTKKDMESGKIMDRLVCGDVGFGKTEVAIRAAFKAVQDNKQVAYLVPTTILAEQHFNNFVGRMKDFPVNIRMLSRFCSPKDVKKTINEIKNGMADIVIGTHRLLSKDVEFKNLGLLIIDEEQRFGVKHKEQIKQIKKNVDVLTLTATPIPRTLHMSMVGLRDISLLEEPPVDRMPIQTYVMEYDLEFVKEAINRELARQGQVYYVYNRVNTIEDIVNDLRRVIPNANIRFAHGKMNERELENIMHEFVNKEIDVLVSTTIIETGLDIPNVNTIIIHDADTFGLSQLYQLRGRVGRSNRSAYAFLLYRRDKMIKEVAEKRLMAIREFTDLGSGYKISMKDLEIRGAGNLLGQEQSGNIEAVGYDLYCKMLHDAIKRLSGQLEEEDFVTSIDLPIDAYIADNYVKNEYMKIDLYKRISKCQSREDNDEIIEEVKDRFGEPPKSFYRLLDVAYIKALAHSAYITDIKYIGNELRFVMLSNAPVKPERMDMLLKRYSGKLKFSAGKESCFSIRASKSIQEELLEYVETVINNIKILTNDESFDKYKEQKELQLEENVNKGVISKRAAMIKAKKQGSVKA